MSDKNKKYTAEDVIAVADLHESKQDDDSFWEQYATLEDQQQIAISVFKWHLEAVNQDAIDTVEGFAAALEGATSYTAGFFAGVAAEREANAGSDSK